MASHLNTSGRHTQNQSWHVSTDDLTFQLIEKRSNNSQSTGMIDVIETMIVDALYHIL